MTSVIVGGARTPIGRLLGGLRDVPATRLGELVIRAALRRSGTTAEQVEYVIMGQVLTAGAGQLPARQSAVAAGIPRTVPAIGINKVCLSGLDAIALADQLIRAGEFDIVVAGGMESMTGAPHLLTGQRDGYRYGDVVVRDHMALDGLTDAYDGCSMGELTDRHNERLTLTRVEQDEFAARSHQRAAAAREAGVFAEEIVPVPVARRGEQLEVVADEQIRPDTTIAGLAKLRPAFRPTGTITAGSSSPISDGACAVVVMRRERATALGLPWLAEIGPHGNVAGPDNSLHAQPAGAIRHALSKAGRDVGDLDLVEINEAFASVVLHSTRDLGLAMDRVNVHGGAIALGHPIGASGARLVLTLAHELRRRGGGLGAAAACGGGGQGSALLVWAPGR